MILLIANPPTTTTPLPVVAGNNVVAGNTLPANTPGPSITQASAFIDGGGNICGPTPEGSPITCQ